MDVQQRPSLRVRIQRHGTDGAVDAEDEVVVEEPLEVWIEQADRRRRLGVTMRTPGHDLELAVGLLYAENILSAGREIRSVSHTPFPGDDQEYNSVRVELDPSVPVDWSVQERPRAASSACGICGRATIDDLRQRAARLEDGFRLDPVMLGTLGDRLRARQGVFATTGGLHAAALVSPDGSFEAVREDVGRHNAVDKLVGHRLQQGPMPIRDRILLVSGRAGYEIVQKAARAGIAAVVAVGAPSTLAVDTAREVGVTLVGFLRGDRFNVYAAPHRVLAWDESARTNPGTGSPSHR